MPASNRKTDAEWGATGKPQAGQKPPSWYVPLVVFICGHCRGSGLDFGNRMCSVCEGWGLLKDGKPYSGESEGHAPDRCAPDFHRPEAPEDPKGVRRHDSRDGG